MFKRSAVWQFEIQHVPDCIERKEKMDSKKKKGFALSIAVCLITIAYIGFSTVGISLEGKDIMHFMFTTIIVPALVLLCYGIIVGRKYTLLQSIPQISVTTLIVFAASCLSMVYMYHTGDVFDMLQNTVTADQVVLDINDSITLGTVVQQALIFLVCACVGSGIGSKSAAILSKIKN